MTDIQVLDIVHFRGDPEHKVWQIPAESDIIAYHGTMEFVARPSDRAKAEALDEIRKQRPWYTWTYREMEILRRLDAEAQ